MSAFKFKLILCTLMFACFCLIVGCGSDNSSGGSASRKDQKPQAKQANKKAQVMELLINGPKGKGVAPQAVTPRKMGAPNVVVTPPDKPGELGITQQEIEAARRASEMIDPKTLVVIPPSKPGERGLTQAEVDALKPKKEIDPKTLVVIPPSKPGERGLTQAEVDALKPKQESDAKTLVVIPPSKPGERGLTQAEVDTIKASRKESFNDAPKPPPMPPTSN